VFAQRLPALRSACCVAVGLLLAPAAQAGPGPGFRVEPAAVTLEGNFARAQLVVTACGPDGGVNERSADLTHQAAYASSDPRIVSVDVGGRLLAVGNGEATVGVTAGGVAHAVPVKVTGVVPDPSVSFSTQVMPVIAKAGCNAGACHASQFGKGGFKLSVFGFAPDDDYRAIVRDGMGRRADCLAPGRSLVLLKPTLGVPHEGGRRLEAGSVDYRILAQWLARGAPPPEREPAKVTSLTVAPARRVGPEGLTQQLRVVAGYSDGRSRDVTAWARYDSMDEGVLRVTRDGLVQTVGRGQGVAMVRFEGLAQTATVVVPFAEAAELPSWAENNFVDRLAAAKFREVGITPAPLCDDATFLRRAYLDATGTAPTPERAAAYFDSADPDKRTRLVDELLGLTGDPARDVHTNDYAAFWALKWADLIRSSSTSAGEQGMWALNNWLKESFRQNKSFDRFVRELLTARGSTYSSGPANYFRIARKPEDLTEATAQLFLGVRLQCAKCHNHPYERISQDDYYGFAAFFARVGNKTSQEFGIFGRETIITVRSDGEVAHPKTGRVMKPTSLFGKPAAESGDRRRPLAEWMTAADNPFFARNVANRYAAYLLGRGLVEPVDDLRATNPASNPELLDALAADFVRSGFDVKHLMRTIMTSRLYQLDSQPTKANAADEKFYSHYRVKRLAAEPLLDAVDAACGTRTKFQKVPLGTKAIELPDATYNNYFLTAFGKPRREAVCECERVSEPNLAQALHTLNGDVIAAKVAAPAGRVARLLAAKKGHEEIVNELYLAALARRPTEQERVTLRRMRSESPDAKAFYEDLLWSLINSKQFLFVH
jgi:hypothetical protein